MKRIVVLSDMQIPLHDKRAIKAVIKFVKDYEPDELFCVGDEADCLAPARWSKGYVAEHSNLQRDLDETTRIMAEFREALGDYPFHLMRSNHGDRIQRYAEKYAPAFSSLRDLKYEKLLGYRDLDITYHNKLWSFAPGWVMGHGDEGPTSRYAGGTAMALAKKIGMSVLCGHTHKLGLLHFNTSYNGKVTSSLYGFEVGNMMDLKQATYLKGGSANWQSSFGILYIDKGKVTPIPVPIINNSFVVEGKTYKW
jgi:hypothetical protein